MPFPHFFPTNVAGSAFLLRFVFCAVPKAGSFRLSLSLPSLPSPSERGLPQGLRRALRGGTFPSYQGGAVSFAFAFFSSNGAVSFLRVFPNDALSRVAHLFMVLKLADPCAATLFFCSRRTPFFLLRAHWSPDFCLGFRYPRNLPCTPPHTAPASLPNFVLLPFFTLRGSPWLTGPPVHSGPFIKKPLIGPFSGKTRFPLRNAFVGR